MTTRTTWTTADILKATGGSLLCGREDHLFSGIGIDSRTVDPEELFIAIRGAANDAHQFIGSVLDKGVQGLVIEADQADQLPVEDWRAKDITCVAVRNTTWALGDIAAAYRRRFDISVAAITGSVGKTTTREMTASVVSQRFKTMSSRKNFNNEFGLPLTLLRLTSEIQWMIVELGMNHLGEISRLADICWPDIGVITNIGPVHLEGVGSIEGVMQAKGELLEKVKPSGSVVLNADDDRVRQLAQRTDRPITFFGESPEARVRSASVQEKAGGVSFELILPNETVPIELHIPGTFMVSNALAAATVGHLLGMSGIEIKAGLEAFRPVEGRMSILETGNGVHIINDTYNANPAAVNVAIKTLCSLRADQRAVLVFADMLELGEQAEALHRSVGATVARSDITRLYLTGQFCSAVQSGATENGFDAENIFIGTKKDIVDDLSGWLRSGDWVLIKGSRAMGMEEIVRRLLTWGGNSSSSGSKR